MCRRKEEEGSADEICARLQQDAGVRYTSETGSLNTWGKLPFPDPQYEKNRSPYHS